MNMRKSFYQFLFMAAFMLLPLAASAIEIDGINYNLTVYDKTAEVAKKAYQGSVIIPDYITYNGVKFSVTGIGAQAFEGCTELTSVTIGNNVKYIRESAFVGCSGLTSVTMGNRVTTIAANAFQDCKSLVSIDVPDTMKTIETGAFRNCIGLTSIVIPNSVTTIEAEAFEGCISLTSIVIPNSVTTIETSVFKGCSSLTSVVMSNSLKTIGSDAFMDCEALTSITIPLSVTSIGNRAFYGCSNLASVVMGSGVEYIGTMAFANCKALTDVYCYAKEMPLMVNGSDFVTDAFQGSPIEQASLYVPVSMIELYKSLEPWKNFKNIISVNDAVYGKCGDNLTWKYEEATHTLTIFGSGAMPNYDYVYYKAPWLDDYRNDIREVIIEEGVTTIGVYSFEYCNAITSVAIPNSVTSIGDAAFSGCISLSSIDIPSSVTSIGKYAFAGAGLTSVTIPDNVTMIGNGAFDQCKNLTSAIISNNVKSLSMYLFNICPQLTSVTIPESVTSIDESAFSGCTGLTSITLPASVTSIGKYAFENCSGLTSLTVSGNLNSIGYDAFKGSNKITDISIVVSDLYAFCNSNTISLIYSHISGLVFQVGTPPVITGYRPVTLIDNEGNEIKDLVIPSDVTSIGTDAFSRCGGVKSITIPGSVTQIGREAFSWCTGLTDVYCYAKDVPNAYTFSSYDVLNAFYGSNVKNVTLHVPAASVWDYKTQAPWKDFGSIVPLDDVDGVVSVHKECSNTTIKYDLQGRRLTKKPTKGVYIQDGKKVVVK